MSFAVVAEEVRSLALRAADAARNTSNLVEDTGNKVKDGFTVVKHITEAFSDVSTSIEEAVRLIDEIHTASEDQAKGIDQIDQAVNGMSSRTLQTVANSEETTHASTDMKGQAERLREIVGELVVVVEGSKKGNINGS